MYINLEINDSHQDPVRQPRLFLNHSWESADVNNPGALLSLGQNEFYVRCVPHLPCPEMSGDMKS